MGDKSPKDKQKQATQKQTKNKAANQQKGTGGSRETSR